MFLQALCYMRACSKRATSVKKMSDIALSREVLRTSREENRACALCARAHEVAVIGWLLRSL